MSQQINLYNPLFLKQEKHFSAQTMAQALGVIALALAGLYAYAVVESSRAERTARQQRELLANQRDQLVKLGAQIGAQGVSRALEAEVARAESEVRTRQATLDALNTGELGNTAGFSEFFAAFGRQAMGGVWLTAFSVSDAGNQLAVTGRAVQADLVPAYLRALSREPMMRGRQVTEMKLAAKQQVRAAPGAPPSASVSPDQFVEFTLLAPLKPRAPEPAGGTR